MQVPEYKFQASYEYQGNSSAINISKTVSENFLWPCWTERYKDKDGHELYLNMLDVRYFKKDPKTGVPRLVYEDESELEELKKLQNIKTENMDINDPEKDNFKREALELCEKWDSFKEVFCSEKGDKRSSKSSMTACNRCFRPG